MSELVVCFAGLEKYGIITLQGYTKHWETKYLGQQVWLVESTFKEGNAFEKTDLRQGQLVSMGSWRLNERTGGIVEYSEGVR